MTDAILRKLREQLDWRTSDGKPQKVIILSREHAEAVCEALSHAAGVTEQVMEEVKKYNCPIGCWDKALSKDECRCNSIAEIAVSAALSSRPAPSEEDT